MSTSGGTTYLDIVLMWSRLQHAKDIAAMGGWPVPTSPTVDPRAPGSIPSSEHAVPPCTSRARALETVTTPARTRERASTLRPNMEAPSRVLLLHRMSEAEYIEPVEVVSSLLRRITLDTHLIFNNLQTLR